MYTVASVNKIMGGTLLQNAHAGNIDYLLTDSRRLTYAPTTLFFAIKAPRRNGHDFIPELYEKGVRSFVVEEDVEVSRFPQAGIIRVEHTVSALQQLAAFHRRQFSLNVIGITGSNGKTIIKEWLGRLLEEDHNVVKNPQSYNSQTGVPLSVWQINTRHDTGIFEAGISRVGEMEALERIIQPGIGILTHIGEAHDEGFSSSKEKIKEKLKLFAHCHTIIFNTVNEEVTALMNEQAAAMDKKPFLFSWGPHEEDVLFIRNMETQNMETRITARYREQEMAISIPFTDKPSVENAIHCWCTLLHLGYEQKIISERMAQLEHVAMRLEQVGGINGCILINDSYSADLSALQPALDHLAQMDERLKKTLILSDILQSGRTTEELMQQVRFLLVQKKINRFIGIGPGLKLHHKIFEEVHGLETSFYESTAAFRESFSEKNFYNEAILLKGARVYEFEQIVRLLEEKVHDTILEIHLDRLVHNLRVHQQMVRPETKLMVVVKAFSYGSGSVEVAQVLQQQKVDYLTVAYADEGVELRKAGIQLPIMVMNTGEAAFDVITQYGLEPEVYSPEMLRSFLSYLKRNALQQYPVHIKLDTGMHRLGFSPAEMPELERLIGNNPLIKIKSAFSHLAGSENPALDEFTRQQFNLFTSMVNTIKKHTAYPFLTHIANSAAILRHPWLQCDMVRLGIGLYGIEPQAGEHHGLQEVCALKTTIAQIKHLQPGETVGYNRAGKIERESVIATVRIGYADGYPRNLGNGRGKMLVNGHTAPVIGNVCMDMTMLDITGIPNVNTGDYVLIFGPGLPVTEVAVWAQTIPYELLTGISQRVKRVYYGQ